MNRGEVRLNETFVRDNEGNGEIWNSGSISIVDLTPEEKEAFKYMESLDKGFPGDYNSDGKDGDFRV